MTQSGLGSCFSLKHHTNAGASRCLNILCSTGFTASLIIRCPVALHTKPVVLFVRKINWSTVAWCPVEWSSSVFTSQILVLTENLSVGCVCHRYREQWETGDEESLGHVCGFDWVRVLQRAGWGNPLHHRELEGEQRGGGTGEYQSSTACFDSQHLSGLVCLESWIAYKDERSRVERVG